MEPVVFYEVEIEKEQLLAPGVPIFEVVLDEMQKPRRFNDFNSAKKFAEEHQSAYVIRKCKEDKHGKVFVGAYYPKDDIILGCVGWCYTDGTAEEDRRRPFVTMPLAQKKEVVAV